MEKKLFITTVNIFEKDGRQSIPTALLFTKDRDVLYGAGAVQSAVEPEELNENFKIDLGRHDPGKRQLTRDRFATATGDRKSAYELTDTFFDRLLKDVNEWGLVRGHRKAKRVMISEPLSFFATGESDWLANYRDALRRILRPHFDDVQFLPEPFAVFQYYRYGVKHTYVTQDRKYFALVIDFGGGTFDVSVVETTKEGDISDVGAHSKPLGAHSKPIGGFVINEHLAEAVIAKLFESGSEPMQQALRCIANHRRYRAGELDLSSLSTKNRTFIRNFGRILSQVETWKIQLSNLIGDWRLSADLNSAVSVEAPTDPFEEASPVTRIRFTANEMRSIYIDKVWDRELKGTVKAALRRAEEHLQGRTLNVALLSGGSANLRWLKELLQRDFADVFSKTHVVSMADSFQEVVAKGLAIECARRTYDPNTEFNTVTYNPLCLVLNPDKKGLEAARARLLSTSVKMEDLAAGQLLPSATILKSVVGQTLTWKIRLDHPPRQALDYYFLRETLDPDDLESRYNIVHSAVVTEPSTSFESSIWLELMIREDSTAVPRFVYRRDRDGNAEIYKDGQPFCLDMVAAPEDSQVDAFLGIDFGTSNSSVSAVDRRFVELCQDRNNRIEWLELNDLAHALPFPVATPIRSLLGSTTRELVSVATIDVLESLLAFSSYFIWANWTSEFPKLRFKGFNGFAQRSMGPLWKLLKDLLAAGADKSSMGRTFAYLKEAKSATEVDDLIAGLNAFKHRKGDAQSSDGLAVITRLANACNHALDGYRFGFFEEVKKQKFRQDYQGFFRVACATAPFHEVLSYSGSHAFSEDEALLLNADTGVALSLSPLIFWEQDSGPQNFLRCFIFDGIDRTNELSFKSVSEARAIKLVSGEHDALRDGLFRLRAGDLKGLLYTGLIVRRRPGFD